MTALDERAATTQNECTCEKLGLEPKHNELRELNHTGDTKTIWNPENPDEVQAAKDTWNRLVRDKKYLAYKVDDEGGKGEQVRAFNPQAGRLILTPQLVGG